MTFHVLSGEMENTLREKASEVQICKEEIVCRDKPILKEMYNDMGLLHPAFRAKAQKLIDSCKSLGIEILVVETYRTYSRQDELYKRGKATRLSAGRSRHQHGSAVDIVPIVKGRAKWHNRALWRRIGSVGEGLGLKWGGRWKRLYDPGHFEQVQEEQCKQQKEVQDLFTTWMDLEPS